MIPDRSVMLSYPHAGTVRAEFLQSIIDITASPDRSPLIGSVNGVTCGSLLPVARNMIAAGFLDSGLEWLWTVDTDIVFNPGTLAALTSAADPAEVPIVSALYYTLNAGRKLPAAGLAAPGDPADLRPCGDPPGDGLVRVDATGAGCLLIHRVVLEKIQADAGGDPCWFRPITDGNRSLGEDLSFSVRLNRAGFPLYVHCDIRVGHAKTVIIE